MCRHEGRITVRRASVKDSATISALSAQLGYPSAVDRVRERLLTVGRSRCDAVYVAQSAQGVVIGWVHVAERQLVMTDRDAQIEGLVVDEAWRRKGVGHLLLRTAEQWAVQRGHGAIRVGSNIVRAAAHEFYQKQGYREVKRQVVYRRDLEQM
jgi:GNAT superfamily N-acetyltransferase